MEKQLIAVGNSLALVIDKPMRQALGIGRASRLRVTTDGVRLVIEPIAKGLLRASATGRNLPFAIRRAGAIRVYDALVGDGLLEHWPRLAGSRWAGYRAALVHRHEADPNLTTTMDRLDVCIEIRNAGGSWDDAIGAALAAVPELSDMDTVGGRA